ncbi:MAG TPA: hypothetical protein VH143_26470 [Kofleriaceae bacterium]|jgi:hypothetical protein|nr:hypothetical protein [Kofleriaceae bacterium]
MVRPIWIAAALFVAACSSKPAANQDPAAPPGGGDKIAVPGAKSPVVGGASAPTDESRFQLQADEGTLTIDKAEGKAGADLIANIKITPASGRHVSTEFPIKITLEPTDGVKLAKTELTAGGSEKSQGDAATLSEQLLAFAVHASSDKPGAYEVKGMLKFGICDKDSCHPKKQPITIAVAAN